MILTLTAQQLMLLGAGAALGGAIFGVVGFAYGVVISIFLHHAFPAADVIFIVVAGALVLNIGLLPRFGSEIRWRKALPFLVGATGGLPIGFWLLATLDGRVIRTFIAILVIGYGLFALRQHARAAVRLPSGHERTIDGGIGFVGGVIGGISGLGPLVPAVWFGLRGMNKIEQRALAQPFGLYVQGIMTTYLVVSGSVGRGALEGLAVATPLMLLAAFVGLRGFDRLSTQGFQRTVVIFAVVGAGILLARQL